MLGFKLTKYGWREVSVATVIAGGLCVVLAIVFWPAVVLPVVVWVWVVWFFRDPDRQVPTEAGVFVSPADGRVTDITNIGPEGPLGCDGVRVGVFMSIFDVHVNRSPADAVVVSITRHSGLFLDARDPNASERNASTTIRLRYNHAGREFPIVVRQVAGLLARRIVTDITEEQRLHRGQRIGMIKFGSRLELMVPAELVGRVCVQIASKVRAGQTILIETERLQTND